MDAVDPLVCLTWCAFPSVNPMGRPVLGPAPSLSKGGCPTTSKRWFRDLGVAVPPRADRTGTRQHHRAVRSSLGARRTVLFDVHQDTVPTEGMTIPPFRRRSSRWAAPRPRGSCDIKGGMAAMMTAFARLVRERPAGLGVGDPGLHGRRGVHAHRVVAPGRAVVDGLRRGDHRRADQARHRRPPQGGGPLEDPDAWGRLPLIDAGPGRQRHLPDGGGWSGALADHAANSLATRLPTRFSVRRACRSGGSRGG